MESLRSLEGKGQHGELKLAACELDGMLMHGSYSLFKGLYPLWGRQIPYTMMKFASFENIVEAIYGYMPKSKSEYGRGTQTAVSFAGGYAGQYHFEQQD